MTKKKISEPVEDFQPVLEEKKVDRKWWGVGGLVAAIVYFWYRTGAWPVVAVVNGRPITRFEVDQMLYKQQGQVVAESLVTKALVTGELARLKIKPSEKEIDDKVEEIKKSLGEGQDLNQVLTSRGMTMNELRGQISLQLGVEKALGDKSAVASDEAEKYIKDNEAYFSKDLTTEAKLEQANRVLRDQKIQAALVEWLEGLKKKAKVWRAYTVSEPSLDL